MSQPGYIQAAIISTSQYSYLNQERLYLLSALASEEDCGERLTRAFETLQSKLGRLTVTEATTSTDNATSSPATPESPRKIKHALKSLRYKLAKCQHRERALAQSLAQVVAHMEGLKHYQWRSAKHSYSQQHQHSQMAQMPVTISTGSPGFAPGFALQSPMGGETHYLGLQQPLTARAQRQQQQYGYSYPLANSPNQYYPQTQQNQTYDSMQVVQQLPAKPILTPQTHYAPIYNSQQYQQNQHQQQLLSTPTSSIHTFTTAEFQELADAISPCDLSFVGLPPGATATVAAIPTAGTGSAMPIVIQYGQAQHPFRKPQRPHNSHSQHRRAVTLDSSFSPPPTTTLVSSNNLPHLFTRISNTGRGPKSAGANIEEIMSSTTVPFTRTSPTTTTITPAGAKGTAPPPRKNSMAGRLSVLDATSAGIRLDRKAQAQPAGASSGGGTGR